MPNHAKTCQTMPNHAKTISNQIKLSESQGTRVLRSKDPKVQDQRSKCPMDPWSQGTKEQDILESHSNMSLTLKRVHFFLKNTDNSQTKSSPTQVIGSTV